MCLSRFELSGRTTEKNEEEAFFCYKKSVEKGNLGVAYYVLASLFSDSNFLTRDIDKAIKNYTKGAERNDSVSCVRLSRIFFSGINKDLKKSAEYVSKGAMLGSPTCLVNYAYSFLYLVLNDKKNARQFYEIALSDKYYYSASCIGAMCYKDKNMQQAIYYCRIALFAGVHTEITNIDINEIFNGNKNDYTVTYHYAMATNDIKTLHGALANDPDTFNQLWCQDLDSKIEPLKNQSIERMVTLEASDEKLHLKQKLSQRMKANLAIYYFEKDTAETIEKALKFTDGLGVKELTAEEAYQLGFWLYSALTRLELTEHSNLQVHGLLSDSKQSKKIEQDLFGEDQDKQLLNQVIAFLTEAVIKKHPEAQKLLSQIEKGKIVIAPKLSKQSFLTTETLDSKHKNKVNTSALSLDDSENAANRKKDF